MNITDVLDQIPSPCYVLDEARLLQNLETIKKVKDRTGCKVILALKAFSMYSAFPQMSQYLDGTCASGLHEARLGREEFGPEVHVFSPVYINREFSQICKYVSHVSFNSFRQFYKYKRVLDKKYPQIEYGLRINPEHSTGKHAKYNPCSLYSRLGITSGQFEGQDMAGVTGLHFHTLCEQNSDDLQSTLVVVEQKFGRYIKGLKWVNFGGGHHITRADYDVDLLCKLISDFQKKYGVQVILEPGEAVVLNAGYLVATVLDIVFNQMDVAVLDASAAAHMPDVLEMPYRPEIYGAGQPDDYIYPYRLTGNTCLAGDIIGDYSFPVPLKPGRKLLLQDMAHYSMVKNNTFNGVNLPSIAIFKKDGSLQIVKKFGYGDFKKRLS